MNRFNLKSRTVAFLTVIGVLAALFIYVALRSGPLAPVSVTVTTVRRQALQPALFGIGTVEAHHTYKIGPTSPGRLKRLYVDVGDFVKAGQVLGEMDPVDLDYRIRAESAALAQAKAALQEAEARQVFAKAQAVRYRKLLKVKSASEEVSAVKQQELKVATAALLSAKENLSRIRSEKKALIAQRKNLELRSDFNGLVVKRDVDPGTTVVAGQTVIEIIDPNSIWINTRFDQIHATGLRTGLPARIVLRSRSDNAFPGQVVRVEPIADSVTEETLAKVGFKNMPTPLPPIGELAEITVSLPKQPDSPVIPNAAIRNKEGQPAVWVLRNNGLALVSVELGVSDLNGQIQVKEGLNPGEKIIVYSEKALGPHSNIRIVKKIPEKKL